MKTQRIAISTASRGQTFMEAITGDVRFEARRMAVWLGVIGELSGQLAGDGY